MTGNAWTVPLRSIKLLANLAIRPALAHFNVKRENCDTAQFIGFLADSNFRNTDVISSPSHAREPQLSDTIILIKDNRGEVQICYGNAESPPTVGAVLCLWKRKIAAIQCSSQIA
jgi:hypothetical protein